ncbi:MAG: hypothetical protein JEZ12_24215 [Desulfobacterium sp.]|nr:hypothetical protein [Desulfobacterium sp.]
MAKANKKSSKHRKKRTRAQVQFADMALDQVVAKGDQLLSSGNAREALKAFKYLKKAGVDSETLSPGLFKAYLMRYGQLMEKKMMKEAAAVLASALEFLPPGSQISPETLGSGLRLLPLEKGVALYGEFLSCNEPMPEMERLIGNRAVLEDALPLLAALPGEGALAREKPCLEKASHCMNAGHWEDALKALKPIPRKSPFAEIKIFAKLMATFVNDDKKGMQKAISLLGKDFPLTSVPALITAYAREETLPSAVDAKETATLLWGNAVTNERHARALKEGVSHNNALKIKQAATGLAAGLTPAEHDKAMGFLAEMAGQGVMEKTHHADHVMALFTKILQSKAKAEQLFVKALGPKDHFLNDLTQEFWKNLDQLFPDKTEEKLAKALVLVEITQALIRNPEGAFSVKDQLNTLFRGLGFKDAIQIKANDNGEGMHLIALAILNQALTLDRENRDAYGLMLKLPLDSPALRKAMTPLLETMAKVFPDDPRPWLRLAKLYFQKSAVRKAESALKEAFRRAPHDGEVLEQYALSHVVASNRKLTPLKYQLAIKDLDAAAGMGVPALGIYIAEKRLLWDLMHTRTFSRKVFEEVTCGLSLAQTLKVLALFKNDLNHGKAICPQSPRGLPSVFNEYKKQMPTLTSREIRYLLKPVGHPFKALYNSSNCASWFMDKRGTILARLSAPDFTEIALDLVADGATDPVIRELAKRIGAGNDKDPESMVMAFLHLCLTHIRGDRVSARSFSALIDSAGEPVKERLRRISRTLAPIAPGHLRPAYEQFDFNLLNTPLGGTPFPFDLDPFDMTPGQIDALEEMMESLMAEEDDDGWDDFQVEEVFCKGLDTEDIYDMVYDLKEESEWVLENLKHPDRDSYGRDFMDSFETLLKAVGEKGLDSPDAFRKAGIRFARHVPCAQDALRAFNTIGKASADHISNELIRFVLGMKIGL